MGLANFQQYSLTKHFKQRALERFGIPEEKCLKWFRVQAQTMELCDNPRNQDPHQQRFQNADNIIMICNTETELLVLVFQVRLVTGYCMNNFKQTVNS